MLNRQTITDFFINLGIRAGDTLLVHSALRQLGPVKGGADTIIEALRDILHDEGTLAVPTHTWNTVTDEQPEFDVLHSPSHVGVLTNVLRLKAGACRSLHPSHSIAALGGWAEKLTSGCETETTPCPPTSPYGRLIGNRGKILLLGVDLTRCTYFHCLEEIAGCGDIWSLTQQMHRRVVVDGAGRRFEALHRRHDNCKSDYYHQIDELLEKSGIMRLQKLGNCPVRLVDATQSADWLVPVLQKNPFYFWPSEDLELFEKKRSS